MTMTDQCGPFFICVVCFAVGYFARWLLEKKT